MRTEQLEYLSEISKVNSMNKASKNLCISVQALQSSMKNLESELGFQVFDSTYRGTQLTEKGQELLDAWIQFHNIVLHIQETSEEKRVLKGNIPIICAPGVVETVMPRFFLDFKKYHPNAELDLTTVYYEDIISKILSGNIEYALVFSPELDGVSLINWEEQFEFIPLKEMKLYGTVNKKMHLAKQKTVSMSTLAQYDVLVWEPDLERIFPIKKIFQYYAPKKDVIVVKHKKIFDKILREKNVTTLSCSVDGEFLNQEGLAHIPIIDKSICTEFGYVKLKNQKINQQAQVVIDMLQDFLDSI
ncbi:MAG: LysR family transcriptional regulator [Peptococcaceae bacterium]|nr:LysR family transcriptional regulator [Peptococcaceae bacterium]